MERKIAVVAGGTGGVGEGIVTALLKNDYKVVVPTRATYKGERLKEYTADIATGELIIHEGSVSTEESALAFQTYLHNEVKTIDLAVASLGGWHQGYPLYSYPTHEWNRIINDNLSSHFFAVKALVPLLNPQHSCYVHINGFSADEGYAMAAPVAMTAAAQKSMMLSLSKEVERSGIQVHELILGLMKTRDRLAHGHGKEDWYYPEEIGQYIHQLMLSDRATKHLHYLLSR